MTSRVLGIHGQDANPHLWYDVARLPQIAAAIEQAGAQATPPPARSTARPATSWPLRPQAAVATIARMRGHRSRTRSRCRLPARAAGLRDLSPPGFSQAIEEGTEPPAWRSAMTAL